MWAFQYKHGDRPLDGYTIQRAAGRGGFGEVYYAVSDSGREVALKVVQGYEQIELRGITQCMNLKSPHLVTIFDVKYNEQGKPFVIMEYVSGPNLRQMLDEHPAGLGTQKAAFFLREIAKGLQYLHDCGIVHRDLKPGNIFFENGIVKIGDYGLSKAISTSQHSAQTVTVGTVHYMAPEIGAGKYDRSIDIYAMGAVLYEMLTGVPPFVGASPTEVLMKHLQAEPDLSGVEEPFRTAVRRAMAKDPAQRFASVQQMVEAVFGAEHIQMSVSQFSPQELSMIAGRVGGKVLVGAGVGAGTGSGGGGTGSETFSPSTGAIPPIPGNRRQDLFHDSDATASQVEREEERYNRLALDGWTETADDKLPIGVRLTMAGVCALAAGVAVGLFGPRNASIAPSIIVILSACSATAALLVVGRWLARFVREESPWVQRLATAGPAAVMVNLITGPIWFTEMQDSARWSMLILSAVLLLTDARPWLSPARRHRVTPGVAFGVCLAGFVGSMVLRPSSTTVILGVLAATVLMVQLISPWRRRRDDEVPTEERYAIGGLGIRTEKVPDAAGLSVERRMRMNLQSAERIAPAGPPPLPVPPVPPIPPFPPLGGRRPVIEYPPVNRFAPLLWLAAFIILLTGGVILCVAAANQPYDVTYFTTRTAEGVRRFPRYDLSDDALAMTIAGVGALVAALFAFARALTKRFRGWWPYLFRPITRLLCLQAIIAAGIVLGNRTTNWEMTSILAGMIVLAGLTFIIVTFIPSKLFTVSPSGKPVPVSPPPIPVEPGVSPRRRLWALVLCVIGWFGPGGLHRLYVGKIGTGILYLLTWGLFGVGTLIDALLIGMGRFRDSGGRLLLRWEDEPITRHDLARAAVHEPRTPRTDWVDRMVNSAVSVFDASTAASSRAKARAAEVVRATGGGILSAMAGLMLFCGTVTGLALAIDAPGMIDAGRPTPKIKAGLLAWFAELEREHAGASQRGLPFDVETFSGKARATIGHGASGGPVRTEVRVNVPAPAAPGDAASARRFTDGLFTRKLQDQYQNFDREIAAALVNRTKEVARGEIPLSRAEIETQALLAAAKAAQDAIKALEQARQSLAELEASRDANAPASKSAPGAAAAAPTDGPAIESPVVVVPPAPTAGAPHPVTPAPPAVEPIPMPTKEEMAEQLRRGGVALRRLATERSELSFQTGGRPSASATFLEPIDLDQHSVATPLRLAGTVACGFFYTVGLSLVLLSRRHYGAAHMVRAVAGIGCLLAAMALTYEVFGGRHLWDRTAGESLAVVSDEITRSLTSGPAAFFAALVFVLAILLMSWPPRRVRQAYALAGATTMPPATGAPVFAPMPPTPPTPPTPPAPGPVDAATPPEQSN